MTKTGMTLEEEIARTSSPVEARYERKYVVPVGGEFLSSWLLGHPSLIKRQHSTKDVHSLYLDTPGLTTASHVLDGVADRFKLRLRWYNQRNKINGVRFEQKSRQGEAIKKKVQTFSLSKALSLDSLIGDPLRFLRMSSDEDQKTLYSYLRCWRPSVMVSYRRSYYIDASDQVRITIDRDVQAARLRPSNHFLASQRDLGLVILEVKYAAEAEEIAGEIMQSIPVSVSRHSKYLFGVLAGI